MDIQETLLLAKKIFAALKKNSLKELQKIVSCHLHLISWPHAIQKTSQDTVLHMASKYLCTSDILEYLLSEGASVCLDQRNCDGKRPLHEAAQSGSLVAVQLFIRAGATVDPLNRAEWTPLMMAASKPSLESVAITQELLATGSNASLLNKDGWSAGHICCRSGSVAVLMQLLASQPHCCCGHSKNGRTALHTAALHGRTDILELLSTHSSCCLHINTPDHCGTTPFMDAARGGHVPTARFLLKLWPHTDVHFTDALGRSALQIAAETGELETVQFLVNELHLNVLHTDRLGQSSVHSAARAGHSAVVHWLVTEGRCPTHIPDANGRTAEDLATAAGHVKCCEVLRSLCS